MAESAKRKEIDAQKLLATAPVMVIIPACAEEGSIGRVIDGLPSGWVDRVILSTVNPGQYTADLARKFGATVVWSKEKSYGAACRAGIEWISKLDARERPEVVAFVDPDFSTNPQQLPRLVSPILKKQADVVIGSRMLQRRPAGAISWAGVMGTKMACFVIELFCCQRYSDIAPFRAISWEALSQMQMSLADQSWTAEMQVKAARMGLRITEAPVDCRARGKKKSFGASMRTGIKIAAAIGQYGVLRR